MGVFFTTLNQTVFLVLLIAIGFSLARFGNLPSNASTVLSKLENTVFIPALVMGTFIGNFTVERITASRNLLLISTAVNAAMIPCAILIAKCITKDKYINTSRTFTPTGLPFRTSALWAMRS